MSTQTRGVPKHPPYSVLGSFDVAEQRSFFVKLTDPPDNGADFQVRIYFLLDIYQIPIMSEKFDESSEVQLGFDRVGSHCVFATCAIVEEASPMRNVYLSYERHCGRDRRNL
jgi:hypothetical protein